MKYSLLALLFLSIPAIMNAQENEKVEALILGKWENKDFDVEYHFSKASKVYFSQSGFGQSMDYSIDTSKSPIWLDIVMKIGENRLIIPTLLKIVDANTIWIEQFPPTSSHPTNFSESAVTTNKIHVLTRKKYAKRP